MTLGNLTTFSSTLPRLLPIPFLPLFYPPSIPTAFPVLQIKQRESPLPLVKAAPGPNPSLSLSLSLSRDTAQEGGGRETARDGGECSVWKKRRESRGRVGARDWVLPRTKNELGIVCGCGVVGCRSTVWKSR